MTRYILKDGRRTLCFAVSLIVSLAAWCADGQDFFAGVRGGIHLGQDEPFHQTEAFGGIYLPWRWEFCSNWHLRPGGSASAGWIGDGNTSGFIGTLGPFVELGKGRFPLTLEGGAAPTYISRYHFSSRNFSDHFQFTSYIGLNWRIVDHWSVGARFQHMSNAGLDSPNPGLNLEFLSLRYDF